MEVLAYIYRHTCRPTYIGLYITATRIVVNRHFQMEAMLEVDRANYLIEVVQVCIAGAPPMLPVSFLSIQGLWVVSNPFDPAPCPPPPMLPVSFLSIQRLWVVSNPFDPAPLPPPPSCFLSVFSRSRVFGWSQTHLIRHPAPPPCFLSVFSRSSVFGWSQTHLIRCNDCNKLPLELNYRSLFLTYKINYGSLFYHYKKTTVIAKKLW